MFIIEAEKFLVTHMRPLFLQFEKKKTNKQTQASAFVTIFLRQWKIDSFLWNQYKPFKANNMKQFNERNLQITAFAVTAAVV